MVRGLSAKVKKHIGTIGYYGTKQAEELAKVEAFLVENKIDDMEVKIAIEAVKSGEMTAEDAIAKIDTVLLQAYDLFKAAEKRAKNAAEAIAKAEAKANAVETGAVAEVAPVAGTVGITAEAPVAPVAQV